ncbi:MAG: alpha-L-rhamnosidase C-terminal domain-containing protein [Chthonomonadales bacterium]
MLFLPAILFGLTGFHQNPGTIDPRGPITYNGINPRVEKSGMRAADFKFTPPMAKKSPWTAKWIWPVNADKAPVVMIRKVVDLPAEPTAITAWLTADQKYRLYINGQLASRGPVDIGTDYAGGSTHRWFYDTRDLMGYFRKGKNVISLEVFRTWPIGFTITRGKPGLLFEARVQFGKNRSLTIASDSDWRGTEALQFPNASTYDANKEPAGWRMPGFEDTAWAKCKEQPNVWEQLIPSEIPPLMERKYPIGRIVGPNPEPITKDCRYKVTFDRVLSGYPTVRVKGGKGARLTIRATQSATMILGEGDNYFEFPFMTEVVPSLDLEITNVTSPLELREIGVNFTSQPVDYLGSFSCSDAGLNDIWKVSRWAVQICLQTHHLDSPNHQEPISDPGDYLIESMVNYYTFAQPWLARQDIRKFAWLLKDEKYSNFHTSYSIGWLQMLMDYYDFTGDKSLIIEMAPYVHGLLDTYATWKGKNGLISEAPNYMFMDWVEIAGFNLHHPPAVIGQGYLTAFYYHGLDMGSRIAALMGDKERVQKYAGLRSGIRDAFNRELWVEGKGLYRDGKPFQTSVKPYQWLPADKDIETFSPHVNLLAALYDLAPKVKQKGIVERVMSEKKLNTQPWFMHWVFQAIDHVGLFEIYGTPQMRRWKIVKETQSFKEMWDTGDLSHGWCSTPLVQMSSRILGVKPTSPGFKTISIKPIFCDLQWAKGVVPTPHGPVAVSWKRTDKGLTMDITVPRGTVAGIELPVNNYAQFSATINGKSVSALVHVSSGNYHFLIRGNYRRGL